MTGAGTIPDTGDYSVLLEPQGLPIDTLNEDFAIESMTGDISQLGNQSYRILRIEPGKVRAEDARGQSPSIPFWLGEAPGRSDELSATVARLREQIERLLTGRSEFIGDRPAWSPSRINPLLQGRAMPALVGAAGRHSALAAKIPRPPAQARYTTPTPDWCRTTVLTP